MVALGAHPSPLDCWSNTGPTTSGEATFINAMQGSRIPGTPKESTRLLQLARGICIEIAGGSGGNYIVSDLQESIGGISEDGAGNIFLNAQQYAC